MFNRKEYRLKNKDKAREYQRKWRSKNKAKNCHNMGGSSSSSNIIVHTVGSSGRGGSGRGGHAKGVITIKGGIEPNTKSITLRNLLDFIKKYFKDKDKD